MLILGQTQSTKDKAPVDDILTGTGDTLPAEVGSKRLHFLGNPDASKGDNRADKHGKQKGSDIEHGASNAPDEEEVIDGVVGGRWMWNAIEVVDKGFWECENMMHQYNFWYESCLTTSLGE